MPALVPPGSEPRYFIGLTASIPILILTGFGLVTTIPVLALAAAGIMDRRVARLRPMIALTVGLFCGPFVDWLFRADPEASLTSLLHPAMAAAIVVASLATLGQTFFSKGEAGQAEKVPQ